MKDDDVPEEIKGARAIVILVLMLTIPPAMLYGNATFWEALKIALMIVGACFTYVALASFFPFLGHR